MLAIIGGSGMDQLPGLKLDEQQAVQTPYDSSAVVVQRGTLEGTSQSVLFLPRHGADHAVPPHRINYRANLFALHMLGVAGVLAVNAVGGLSAKMGPGVIAIPDQIIDYTWGREHTFFDGSSSGIERIGNINRYSIVVEPEMLARYGAYFSAKDPSKP